MANSIETNETYTNVGKKVDFRVFIWAMGILLLVIGWIFISLGALGTRVDSFTNNIADVKIQLSQIQTDLSWIKERLNKSNAIVGETNRLLQ